MKQLNASMETIRNACIPKAKVSVELVDGMKQGNFVEDKSLKCYTQCVAQMGGVVSNMFILIFQDLNFC